MRTVIGSTTSTLATGASSPRRFEPGHRLVPLEVELDRGGVELLAVMERDAGPDLHRQRLAVRRPFPGRRELRHDRELLVDVDQLVAQRGEHDAPDERARERRIEHVRIFGEAEAQRLRLRRRGGERGRGQRDERTGMSAVSFAW